MLWGAAFACRQPYKRWEKQYVSMRGVGHDSLVHKRYALSAWKSMKACMRREVILVYRHSFVYLFRIAQVCLQLLNTQLVVLACSPRCAWRISGL